MSFPHPLPSCLVLPDKVKTLHIHRESQELLLPILKFQLLHTPECRVGMAEQTEGGETTAQYAELYDTFKACYKVCVYVLYTMYTCKQARRNIIL